MIAQRVTAELDIEPSGPPLEPWLPEPFVYYLMVGPTTVKIGWTRNLAARLTSLRSDAQYVVALECGDRTTERARHLQFAAERFGRREDFLVSDRLKAHITTLQPARDALMKLALRETSAQAG